MFIRLVGALAAWSAMFLAAGASHAAIVLHAPTVTVTEGESGYFDVFFEVTSGSPQLAGYQVGLTISGPSSDVQFTGIGAATDAVFLGSVPALNPGVSLPDTFVGANDILLSAPETPIGDGAGLLRVSFTTVLGDVGSYAVSFDPNETFLSNGMGELLDVDLSGGTIEVQAVPEPTSLALAFFATLGASVVVRRCRKCRRLKLGVDRIA